MRIAAFIAAALLAAQAPAQALPQGQDKVLEPAQQALAAGNYTLAYREFARHADSAPLAQFTLGLFERQGWGRAPNPAAACAWFDKAAQRGVPAAQQFLGDCLARGTGRAVDGQAALQWYRKAGAAGIHDALCAAGDLYIAGTIVPRDVRQGLALCTAAAQAESPSAMLWLADHYRAGGAVPQNLALARYWYDQAAQRHQHAAQFQLGVMLGEGQGGDADPARALFWLEHAAREGYAPAYLPTAVLYANARPDPNTGALTPDNLARIYMWNSAAKARTTDPAQRAEIARIETLVLAVMPAQWKPELDRKVADHLARYPLPQPAQPLHPN